MIDKIEATKLDNGLTVISEHMPGLRSVTVGIWVRRGSRHELAHSNGIFHFIEHTVFKGTMKRTALDIAVESDRLGGHIDAFTSHESTGFTMKVVDSALPKAFDLLGDIVCNPRFDEEELKREQKVIIEEIKMVEDTPDDFLTELFNAKYFPDHPLGRPIEGTIKTVSSFNSSKTRLFHEAEYHPANLVIAAAGNVNHKELIDLVLHTFKDIDRNESSSETINEDSIPIPANPILIKKKKGLEQAHLILATPWPSACSENRFAASLLSSIIGGGTSSRLWQSIREERGLAYSVGAAAAVFKDTGVFQIYAGTSPEYLDQVIDLSIKELKHIVSEPVSNEELRLVKDQSISSILLSLESSSARAATLARQEIVHGRRISPEETIAKIEAVTIDEIQDIARSFFTSQNLSVGILGDLNGFKLNRSRLEI
jgi:predicted Zn-dependent peptidase